MTDAPTSARVELFRGATRDVEQLRFEQLLRASYDEDALHTLKIVAHVRDCRGGKGERKLGCWALAWLAAHHRRELLHNLKHLVAHFGRFDDSMALLGSSVETEMLEMLRAQLMEDIELLNQTGNSGSTAGPAASATGSNNHTRQISMCAKWIPSQQRSMSNKISLHKKLCKHMKLSAAKLRKQYLAPLRSKIATLERHMSAREWAAIDLDKVPSVAMQIHGKPRGAFERHLPERFAAWKAATAELTSGGGETLPRGEETARPSSPLDKVLREIERPRYDAITLPPP